MTEGTSKEKPYKNLGDYLKTLRDRLQETIAETAGAVEIDELALKEIETGQVRPSEDILLLLITHFAIQDDEAVLLWDMAGYDRPAMHREDKDPASGRSLVMVMSLDSRIIYSDRSEVVVNPNGVVINFFQAPNGPYQSQTVGRIGMSREQATSFVKILQKTLAQSAENLSPKNLPSAESKHKHKTDRN